MNVSDVRRLYAYDDWANDRILAAVAGLSDEQFTRKIVSSFSSVRNTLSHIAATEWIWLQRWKGTSPSEPPEWAKAPTVAILADHMHRIAADRRAYLSDLADDAIGSTIHYRSIKNDPFALPLGELLIHCANHSTYHRGQLVTMLRQAGAEPPSTDYTVFVRS
jgi:uncharacterized damage-inducible protein DinB